MLSSAYCSPDQTATLLIVAEAQVMAPLMPVAHIESAGGLMRSSPTGIEE